MALSPITSWLQNHLEWCCSHEIKRHLLLGRKSMTNLDSVLKSRDITLPTKVHSHVWMWELNHKEGWVLKNWCFWTVVLEKTLERPLLLSCISHVRLCVTYRRQPTTLPRPWDSPGKNTGVGCHFLLQCMQVRHESEVAQSCPTLSDRMDCSPPGSSIHGIFQARVLEWDAIAFSKRVP